MRDHSADCDMPEPFKNFINPALVRRGGGPPVAGVAVVRRATVRDACHRRASTALELKARAMQIADALEATLPARFPRGCRRDRARAGAAGARASRMASLTVDHTGLAGWILWPVGEYVARRGIAHPERALRALHAITQRFTAEFAIRPFWWRIPSSSSARSPVGARREPARAPAGERREPSAVAVGHPPAAARGRSVAHAAAAARAAG